jgi:hypothetical protein
MAEEISYRRLVLIAGTASTSSFVVSSLLGTCSSGICGTDSNASFFVFSTSLLIDLNPLFHSLLDRLFFVFPSFFLAP